MSTAAMDLVFLNATVVDGTGESQHVTDIAVRDGRIEQVGYFRGAAKETIDCYGRVVCPGFVDIHGHSDYSLLMDRNAHSKLMQGITTEVGGNCGYHAAPVSGQVAQERAKEYKASGRLRCDWRTSEEYEARLLAHGIGINFVRQIGYNTLRSAVTNDSSEPLTPAQRDELNRLVEQEFARGVAGLSYGVAYAPACFSSTEDLVEVARINAEYDGLLSFHMRDEGDGLMDSVEEVISVAQQSGSRLQISHLKAFRQRNWNKIDVLIERLRRARADGIDLMVDRYPHVAMNTQLRVGLPIWVLEGGVEKMKARLADDETRRKVASEMAEIHGSDAKSVLISLVSKPRNKHVEGKFLDDPCHNNPDPWDAACRLIADEGEAVFATFFGMKRGNLDRILSLDYAMVASDASIQAVHKQSGGGQPHPRCFDTFPYFLAKWVVRRGVFTLEQGIHKMTGMPAKRIGLRDRGVIGQGCFADLLVLDLESLRAHSDYEDPMQIPHGIDVVCLNGEIVCRGGIHQGRRAGRILRKEN